MSEIDYALAYDFATADDPGVSYQLRFRPDTFVSGSPWESNPTGQLVAVVVEFRHPRNGHTIAISRPHVHFNDVESAVDSDNWPFLAPYVVDLDQIRARIRTKVSTESRTRGPGQPLPTEVVGRAPLFLPARLPPPPMAAYRRPASVAPHLYCPSAGAQA